jgi:hypothetical protein
MQGSCPSGGDAPRRLLQGPPQPPLRPQPRQEQRHEQRQEQWQAQQQAQQPPRVGQQLGRMARFQLAALPWVAGLRRLRSNGALSLELAQRSDLNGALNGPEGREPVMCCVVEVRLTPLPLHGPTGLQHTSGRSSCAL